MIVALDLDGVFRDFLGTLIKQFKIDYPHLAFQIPQSEREITTWSLEEFWPKGWTDEMLSDYFSRKRVRQIYANAAPYLGAIQGYQNIRRYCTKNGHKLIIITSARKPLVQLANWNWLSKNNFLKSIDNVYMRKDKYNVPADILLDDAVHNLKEWQLMPAVSFPGKRVSVCFNRAWNQDYSGIRVWNYDQFLLLLRGVEQKVKAI
tara:strand:- start:3069 stop:3683 length:615 start_codon:yes stop_codon:yes gene_type:complete